MAVHGPRKGLEGPELSFLDNLEDLLKQEVRAQCLTTWTSVDSVPNTLRPPWELMEDFFSPRCLKKSQK